MNKKTFFRLISLVMCLIVFCTCFVSCNSTKKKFIGVWEVTRMVSDSGDLTLGEIIPGVSVEMSIQFFDDNTYMIHHYVNGKKGENSATGTFTVEGDTLVLSSGQTASILGNELVLRSEDDSYWYCTRKD